MPKLELRRYEIGSYTDGSPVKLPKFEVPPKVDEKQSEYVVEGSIIEINPGDENNLCNLRGKGIGQLDNLLEKTNFDDDDKRVNFSDDKKSRGFSGFEYHDYGLGMNFHDRDSELVKDHKGKKFSVVRKRTDSEEFDFGPKKYFFLARKFKGFEEYNFGPKGINFSVDRGLSGPKEKAFPSTKKEHKVRLLNIAAYVKIYLLVPFIDQKPYRFKRAGKDVYVILIADNDNRQRRVLYEED